MNKKRVVESKDLAQQIDQVLVGHDLDAVIPALAMTLGIAGILSEVDKKTLLSFVADTFDKVYENKEHILGDLQ